MSQPVAYEQDFYAWSQHQADALRRLARSRRDLPNDLDLEHVAEEVEDMGRAQRDAVESHLVRMVEHLVKLLSSPAAEPSRGWRREASVHQGEAARRFTPGMRQAIDLARVWRDARRDALADLDAYGETIVPLPEALPFTLDELLDREAEIDALLARLHAGTAT